MFEKFTDRARKVMQLANQEAQRFNHEYIGTEHILLGLIKEGSGVAANVLKNLDIHHRRIRLEVEKLVQIGPDMVTMGKLPQTPRAKAVIKYTMEEARDLHHDYVGTEHLLLGLIREQEGVAAQVLRNLGLTMETVRAEILKILGPSLNLIGSSWTSRTSLFPMYEGRPREERFTDRARKVMQLANREAKRFNHEYIGTEHVLLGVVLEGSGVAANVLKNLDIDLDKVRQEVFKLIQAGPVGLVVTGHLPRTPRTQKAIEYAMEEARSLHHNYVGSEHILLGLLREEEGIAAQILMNLGAKLETVRAEVLDLLGPSSAEQKSDLPGDDSYTIGEPRTLRRLPAACPNCGGPHVVRILWDLAHHSRRGQDELAAGRAMPMLYRLTVGRKVPSWVCLTCEPRWSEVQRMAVQDYEWQSAKDAALLQEQYETAIQLRDQQRELRPRLMALVEELLGRA